MDTNLFHAGFTGETVTPAALVTGDDPIRSDFGTVAASQVLAVNTVIARKSEVRATQVTGVVGDNNAVLWSAKARGVAGNAVTVALVNPSANNAALAITVTGNAISVALATGVAGAITTTGAQLVTAIQASATATALVDVAAHSTSTGAAAVVASAAAALTGGADNGTLHALAPAATDGTQIPVGFLVHATNTTAAAMTAPYYSGGCFDPDLLVWPSSIQTDSQKQALFDGSPIRLRRPT
jgi:hypothetical protein